MKKMFLKLLFITLLRSRVRAGTQYCQRARFSYNFIKAENIAGVKGI
jgi:hypothetical protein